MTKRTLVMCSILSCFAILLTLTTGVQTTHASEVTGSLSSKTATDSQTDGEIGGAVVTDTRTNGTLEGSVSGEVVGSGGNSSGGSRGGGGRTADSSITPAGTVLGATIDNILAPGFPNAGFAPSKDPLPLAIWSTIVTFLRNIVV